MIKIYLFSPKYEDSQVFNHVWENDGYNFFDTVHQDKTYNAERRLTDLQETEYVDLGFENSIEGWLNENYYDWEWVELENSRIQKSNIGYFKIQVSNDEIVSPTLFVKLIDIDDTTGKQNGCPLYFYSTQITESSDQGLSRISYTCEFELDKWATYWAEMHRFAKQLDWEYVDAKNKMCNRFEFLPKYGLYVDYLKCPWLMRGGNYSSVMVRDTNEKFLTLEEWAYLNSNDYILRTMKQWITQVWNPWFENQFFGAFDPKMAVTIEPSGNWEGLAASLWDKNIAGNRYYWKDDTNSKFNDALYNSNGKYKWFVCRVGNNTYNDFNTTATYKWEQSGESKVWTRTLTGENLNVGKTGGSVFNYESIWADKYSRSQINYSSGNTWTITSGTSFTEVQTDEEVILPSYEIVSNEYTLASNPTQSYALQSYTTCPNIIILSSANGIEKEMVIGNKFGKEYDVYYSSLSEVWTDIFTTEKETIVTDEGDYSYNITLQHQISGNKIKFRLLLTVLSYNMSKGLEESLSFKVNYSVKLQLSNIYDVTTTTTNATRSFSGEELMYLPIPKGNLGQSIIRQLNNYNEINSTDPSLSKWYLKFGPTNVLNMVVNDIPPAILALALRNKSDAMSSVLTAQAANVNGTLIYNPFGMGLMKITNYNDTSIRTGSSIMMVSENDYIPVTIALSPRHENIKEVIGGTNFFNMFYELMSNDELTMTQTMASEPFIYSSHFMKWTYFITPNSTLSLTSEKIDFYKMMTTDWAIRLNVNMAGNTNYKLDFNDIKQDDYPMTKSGMEFITSDTTSFPYSTEMMNRYIESNAASLQYGRDIRQSQNDYAMENLKFNRWLDLGNDVFGGAVAGGITAGVPGAIIGGVGGLATGLTNAFVGPKRLERRQKQDWKIWEKQVGEQLANYSGAPSMLNPSGFTSGSLLFNNNGEAKQNSYELFRTYKSLWTTLEQACSDVWLNGYPYCSECKYKEYNNRINYNIIDMNLNKKRSIFTSYLQKKMMGYSQFFANKDYIDEFIDLCGQTIRLWKVKFESAEINSLADVVKTNIEIDRIKAKPFIPMGLLKTININRTASYAINESKLKTGVISERGRDVLYTVTDTDNVYTKTIPFSDISEEITTRDDFLSVFSMATTAKTGTNITLNCVQNASVVNDSLYETAVEFKEGTYEYNWEIKDIIDSSSETKDLERNYRINYANFLLLHNNKNNDKDIGTLSVLGSNTFELNHSINVKLDESNNGVTISVTPVYNWIFKGKRSTVYRKIGDWTIGYNTPLSISSTVGFIEHPTSDNTTSTGWAVFNEAFTYRYRGIGFWNLTSVNGFDATGSDDNWRYGNTHWGPPSYSEHWIGHDNCWTEILKYAGKTVPMTDCYLSCPSDGLKWFADASGIIDPKKSTNVTFQGHVVWPKTDNRDRAGYTGRDSFYSDFTFDAHPWSEIETKNYAGFTHLSPLMSMNNGCNEMFAIQFRDSDNLALHIRVQATYFYEVWRTPVASGVYTTVKDYKYLDFDSEIKIQNLKFTLMPAINGKLPEINVQDVLKSVIFVRKLD